MKIQFCSLAFLAVLASGCMVDGTSEDELGATAKDGAQESVSEEGALGTASQELAPLGDVLWTQGSGPIGLGPISDRVCFLAGMRGNFAGMTESVRVYASEGSWWINGISSTTGVGAWATCAKTPNNPSAEYVWKTGYPLPTYMGTASKRMCYITRVSGRFDSNNDWVYVYGSGGDWYLAGGANGTDLEVRARCVDVTTYGPVLGRNSTQNPLLMDWNGPDVGTCALTRIAGRFDSSADFVHCDYTASAWYLTVAPGANVVASAHARLF